MPTTHEMHFDAAAAAYVPVGQAVQVPAPKAALAVPALQLEQVDAPVAVE